MQSIHVTFSLLNTNRLKKNLSPSLEGVLQQLVYCIGNIIIAVTALNEGKESD